MGEAKRYPEFARLVKAARQKSGLTQKEFAVALSVDVRNLRNWEQGVSKPQADDLFKLTSSRYWTGEEGTRPVAEPSPWHSPEARAAAGIVEQLPENVRSYAVQVLLRLAHDFGVMGAEDAPEGGANGRLDAGGEEEGHPKGG